ncbi:MAG: RdgB/HAM1 family non-canonical purine NTP pyrophosphatase [Dehalococcoidia bacterium]|nr:RdgB/HAM1 family non-canonical purine NTP pyrophosphatase [Dehalococcoidia bacterium]
MGEQTAEGRRILLATNNPGKVREFRRLLEPFGFVAVTPAELGITVEVEESGASYAENAVIKARAFAAAGGMIALADDSGIEVDALGGGPGMYSARYGGPGLDDRRRVEWLLSELAGVPEEQRTARYRAVVAVAFGEAGREPVTFEGIQEGRIGCEPRGERGFGYDPVFVLGDGRTQAEASDEEKDRISHRAQAVKAAAHYLLECGQ